MELIFELPSPMVRCGDDYEYEPSDYYCAMDEQVHEFLKGCLREQYYKYADTKFRRDLLVYMRRHGMSDLYAEVVGDLYNV